MFLQCLDKSEERKALECSTEGGIPSRGLRCTHTHSRVTVALHFVPLAALWPWLQTFRKRASVGQNPCSA